MAFLKWLVIRPFCWRVTCLTAILKFHSGLDVSLRLNLRYYSWELGNVFCFFFSVLLLVRRKKNDASGRIINRLCNIANFVYIDNFYVAHIYTCAMVFLSGKSMPVFRACGEVYHIDFSSLRGRLPFWNGSGIVSMVLLWINNGSLPRTHFPLFHHFI